ncbi:MAG: UvrD-helicase domain-containing protein [Candidatus Accumulibacter sp.]|uniref:ATP-dependent DNA helicase Rep n=4 Tax=Candidatus Accumulibacter TaxID=327159 RepID=A0A7D5SIA5_9PROT|nr:MULTISPECIES: UvrD-helicase domain-containing protein [Candidatus Accumulibacter]QLH49165.1 MAG: UvrD-helicase domain-containing protein [Candidatus Accumulibacter cognatus]MBL8400315.1 UvrD-helicase domain-containing protein [Accumulibacter sp.]MBN8517308.1 UvrD-helicase domain-containing protein [Accumulibacter sp.]MBO3709349.1 UvrD-helicase domain-containing protein [Accumulibacter sp.]MCC2866979.1 UvrD-helicase domain-containing protein [Candidatus Accumulibacter phosphatis]
MSATSVLNPPQREAIRYLDGPLLVLAGAGSGKTRVITEKIVYLIESCGFSPGNIAAITFTNKAAREMQERVGKLLVGKPSRGLTISTFHALGMRILREEAGVLGYKPSFSILDATDCFGIVSELAGSSDKLAIRKLQSLISNWKSALVSPDQARKKARNESEILAANAFASYSATLQAYQAVDFDDLIALPVALFENHPAVRDKWQNRLRYLLIDEYQDTNASQYQLLRLLAGARAAFTAVGDDDQAIYGWRGADIANLRGLPRDYPNLKLIKLEQNYRSTVRILKAANALISHNEKLFDKKLWSELGHGDPITVHVCQDKEKEAESVVMKLQAHRFQHQGAFRDYAILYRGNFQARAVEKFLRQQRVPYLLSGGQSFFEKAEIKDITSYLRLLANQDDDPAFLRAVGIPRRGVGSSTLQALGGYAGERRISLFAAACEQGFVPRVQARQLAPLLEFCAFIERLQARAGCEPAGQVITALLTAIAYEAWLYDQDDARTAQIKWGNVQEFCDWLSRKGDEDRKTLLDLAQTIALINRLDEQDADIDAVRLSTLHAAKGLEFKHVFLIGIEEGVLPHRDAETENRTEEERRLMYVGITRAQRSLHLSYAEKRQQGREVIPCKASRFIAEMGSDDLRFSGGRIETAPDRMANAERFSALKAMLNKGK